MEPMAQTPLSHELQVKETQTGFAGEIGWAWTVEPDGTWRAQRVGPREMPRQSRAGKLAPAELEALSGAVNRLGSDSVANTANAGSVNPYTVEVNYGDKSVKLALPAGGRSATQGSATGAAVSPLTIVDVLRAATGVE